MRRNGGNGVSACFPRNRDMASVLICERMLLLLASTSVISFFAGSLDRSPPSVSPRPVLLPFWFPPDWGSQTHKVVERRFRLIGVFALTLD